MSVLKESQHLKIPLKEIEIATQNFQQCIGKGGYGMVYKGELSFHGSPTTVAVKRLIEQFGQGLKEFLMEIQLLTGQSHPNLISLIGYCDEGKEKIIVYEYAERGSLDQYLKRSNGGYALTWLERLRICVDAARGLDYLHNHVGKHQAIIHRDVKSSNILLDHNLIAKISDLGLSKLSLSGLNRSFVVSHACGTPGYCEPEYFSTGIVTKESDVYSFGVVLFEVFCGRLCFTRYDDGFLLSAPFVKDCYEKKKLDEIVDPALREQMSFESMNKFSSIAYHCLRDDRAQRPRMNLVKKELEELLEIEGGVSSIKKQEVASHVLGEPEPQSVEKSTAAVEQHMDATSIDMAATSIDMAASTSNAASTAKSEDKVKFKETNEMKIKEGKSEDKEVNATVVNGNGTEKGQIIVTSVGGRNGQPKQAKCLETSESVPIDYQFANLSMSENLPSASAAPPALAAAVPAPAAPIYQSVNAKYQFDGNGHHPSDSFSTLEGSLSHMPSFADPQSQQYQMVSLTPSKKALKVLLLHGNLDIWIDEAKNLPNMDMFHKTVGKVFNRLSGNPSKINRNAYVSIAVTTAVIGRTYVISNIENPVWKQHFSVPVAHHAVEVQFLVKDSDAFGSRFIGIVSIPVEQIYSGTRIEGFFPLIGTNGKPCKPGAGLGLSIQYFSIEKLSLYRNGVGAGPQFIGVPGTYFPLRRGGRVTLYQDAHVHSEFLPDFKLDQGRHYVHGSCWNDIFDAIIKARHLIYIAGWSVWHKVKLVRGVAKTPEYTLGDLLRLKSQEGVRVLLLVWDDPTSRSILGYEVDGIMATHDEETWRFFIHSTVQVLLVPRIAGKRHSWIKKQEVGAIYTHNQKTVIVDTDAGYGKRKIIAFVGGLDLCDGRYDSPQHPLFRTLKAVHSVDFHNPTFTGDLAGCPREPWHDMHSKIDGPAAYDVLTNFEERWLKASKPHGLKKLRTSYDDSLLRIERMPELLGVNDQPFLDDRDPEGWHVQIFRSIDSNSVKGFPKDPKEATNKNLVCGKNVLIDMSIHTAYVKAIRSAQHFIYIENQYFIGSSYNWSSYKDLGADNLIPMEIALKIASKIRAHERFAVYIIIPMWPEGVPTHSATQRILFWQNKTMKMMYETIYKALVEVGLEDVCSPQDYLNFFCLGNREAHDNVGDESPGSGNTPQGLGRKNRRFMIYVHSKGMIVDDEYVIIGSANINQRSMEGTRDTEIAMGAYQPHHTWATKLSNPRGQIYGYRMSLWAEHLGHVDDRFTQPESIECVRHVRLLSEANWKQFAADEVSEMRGHLLKYPVEVDLKGEVRSLVGYENFPDVGGQIVGSLHGFPGNLTI